MNGLVKVPNSSGGENSTVELTEEGDRDIAMSVISDEDLHREVRRRENSVARESSIAVRQRRSPD